MDPWQIVLLALAVLVTVASFWGLVYVMNFMRRTGDWIDHHVPLGTNARNARLEAAMRDVEEHYNVCATCGVDNVHYRIFCVLCGAPVEKVAVDESSDTAPAAQRNDDVDAIGRLRRRRARTRREWVRTPDGDGGFRWRRAGNSVGSNDENNAYVVAFRSTQESVAIAIFEATPDGAIRVEVEHEDDVAGSERSPLVCKDGVAFDSMPQAAAKLELQLATHKMQLALASLVDPTEPIVFTNERSEQEPAADLLSIHDTIAMATAPFPERLAAFVTDATTIQNVSGRLSLKIQRVHLLDESIALLAALAPIVVGCNMRLKFLEEEGIDAGGVYREWFLLFNDAIVAPEAGVFTCVDRQSQALHLNPHSRDVLGEDHLVYFLAVGRWLGRALLEGNVSGFHLAMPLLKMILGQPVSFDDLEFFDPETHKNLQWLMENDGVDSLGLDFTMVECGPRGDTKVIELIPGGAMIDVTDSNKREYVDRKLKYVLFESVSPQLFAFLRGIHDVVPMELLRLFDAQELDYMLAGSSEIDVDDWEKHCKFTADLIDHPVRQWFWELVRDMTHQERQRLLQFSTGASRAPLAGFSALTSYDGRLCPFTLKSVKLKQEAYIRSHACFNTLDLPLYKDKDQLRRMLEGILLDDSQGFTIA